MERSAKSLVLAHASVIRPDAGVLGPLGMMLEPELVISPKLPGVSRYRSLAVQWPIIERLFFHVWFGVLQPSEAPAVPFKVDGQHADFVHICGSASVRFLHPRGRSWIGIDVVEAFEMLRRMSGSSNTEPAGGFGDLLSAAPHGHTHSAGLAERGHVAHYMSRSALEADQLAAHGGSNAAENIPALAVHDRIHLLQRLRLGIFDILVVRAVRGQGLLRPAQQRKALAGDPSGISPSPRLAANLIARSISSGVNLPPGP